MIDIRDHGGSFGGGKDKYNIYELPIEVTDTIVKGPYSTNQRLWFGYNNIKVFVAGNNSTLLQAFYRNELMFNHSFNNINAVPTRSAVIAISEEGNIYFVDNYDKLITTYLRSEKYSTPHVNPGFNAGSAGGVNRSNFFVGNQLYFIQQSSTSWYLTRYQISSNGIAVANGSRLFPVTSTSLTTMNQSASFNITRDILRYVAYGTLYEVNLGGDMGITTKSIISPPGASVGSYVGFYGGKHFILGSISNRHTMIEYQDGASLVNPVNYSLEYDEKLLNEGMLPPLYNYYYGSNNIQVNDKITLLILRNGSTYDDSPVYFDLAKRRVIRANRGINQGTNMYPVATLGKVFYYEERGNVGIGTQFLLETKKT